MPLANRLRALHAQSGQFLGARRISVPERHAGDASNSGWLVLGEPDARLGVEMPPHMKVAPKPGQLVLFPSWMWHGTRPFAEGGRLYGAVGI